MQQPKYCDTQSYEQIDPLNDIYYCYKCKKNHKCNEEINLKNAIDYFSLERIKQLIEKDDSNKNWIEYMVSQLLFSSGLPNNVPYIGYVTADHFRADYPYKRLFKEEAKQSAKLYIETIKYLASIHPEWVTEKILNRITQSRGTELLQHLPYNAEDKEPCIICLSTHSFGLIDTTCSCKHKIHTECLIDYVKKIGNICKNCGKNNGGVIDNKNRVIFPFHDIYKMPLLNSYVTLETLNEKFHYALAYLQVERVLDLAEKMTQEEYISYYGTADCYALHNIGQGGYVILKDKRKITTPLRLKDMPYSNLSREDNTEKFDIIEEILYNLHTKFCSNNM